MGFDDIQTFYETYQILTDDMARDLISKLLEKDPVKRYTPENVLEHPRIKKYAHEGYICNEVEINVAEQSLTKEAIIKPALDTKSACDSLLDVVNKTFSSKYEFTEEILGEGVNGSVRIVVNKHTNSPYALKTLETSCPKSLEDANMELGVLLMVAGHPNFVQIEEYYRENSKMYIVMEQLNYGSLFDAYFTTDGLLEEKCVARIIRDVAVALKYLHQFGIAHRDVKLENIMCSSEDILPVKLIDFGLASGVSRKPCCDNHKNDIFISAVGTPLYMAPEVAQTRLGNAIHSTVMCDMWSLGVTLFEMIYGEMPFMLRDDCDCSKEVCNECMKSLFESIVRDDYTADLNVDFEVSEGAKDLISKLLVKDPMKRYTADQVLNHSWILEHAESTYEVMQSA